SGRTLALGNCAFHINVPSLAEQPVALQLGGDLIVDGHRLEALSLTADLKRLVSAARRIHPAAALVAIKATMPGSSLTMQGGLQEADGFRARARLDLPRVMAVVGPLLPPTVPAVHGDM